MAEEIIFRSVQDADAEELSQLFNYYVNNTVITFRYDTYTPQDILGKIQQARDDNLPFVIATNLAGKMLGFISLSGFRASKRGYYPTTELSLFCFPEHTGKGLGTKLVNFLVAILRNPTGHRDFLPDADQVRQVRHIVAGMAIDIDGPRKGWALRDFYKRCGFVQVAHMPEVGWKFDRWIDILFMQLTL